MAVSNAAPIISTRFEGGDGRTLAGYESAGGYTALRKALAMSPDAVLNEVKAANLQGRGGAGFPAGAKWSFLPKDVFPRYFVVNGDESEPGTCKDRPLMEEDPHQLLEGLLISCYAVRAAQAFVYVRGEMALAQERLATALNEAYAAGYVGRDIMGTGWSIDVVLHWGAGAYIGQGALPPAHRGQQRRDPVEHPLDHPQRRGRLRRPRHREGGRHPAVRPFRPRAPAGGLRGGDGHHDVP